ncbi:Trafficking protein particle complex subunit [Entamoeba marina]
MISKADKVKAGDSVWADMKKINSELLTMTYGGIVIQLLKENEYDAEKVNKLLEEMGYNIGVRIIEEYLAKVEEKALTKCTSFKDVIESLAFVGFKMFMGVPAECYEVSEKQWKLSIPNNILAEFVELPPKLKEKLWYSNIYCGVIRGALEMLKYKVECKFTGDMLKGNVSTEIDITLVDVLEQKSYVRND